MAMFVNRYSLSLITVPLVVAALCVFDGDLKEFFGNLDALGWLSVVGFYLTFAGLVYSYIAVLKVSQLSDRYVIRLTLPSASKRLADARTRLPRSQSQKSSDLISETYLAEIPVLLKSIRETRGHNLKDVIEEAEEAYKKLSEWLHNRENLSSEVKICPHFWELIAKIGIVSEEIKNFMREDGVRQ